MKQIPVKWMYILLVLALSFPLIPIFKGLGRQIGALLHHRKLCRIWWVYMFEAWGRSFPSGHGSPKMFVFLPSLGFLLGSISHLKTAIHAQEVNICLSSSANCTNKLDLVEEHQARFTTGDTYCHFLQICSTSMMPLGCISASFL